MDMPLAGGRDNTRSPPHRNTQLMPHALRGIKPGLETV